MLTSIGTDEETLISIKCHFNHEILSDCSEYGDDLFNLNLLDILVKKSAFMFY